jgi:hypothetical protein
MHTSYLENAVDKDGKPILDAQGKPSQVEVFGLHPDTPEPAPNHGQRRRRRPGEEADLVDESVVAAQLADARAKTEHAEGRATAAEQLLRAEQAKAAALESLMKSLGITPEALAEAQAKIAATAAKTPAATPKK